MSLEWFATTGSGWPTSSNFDEASVESYFNLDDDLMCLFGVFG